MELPKMKTKTNVPTTPITIPIKSLYIKKKIECEGSGNFKLLASVGEFLFRSRLHRHSPISSRKAESGFHRRLINNNFLSVGNANKEITVFNFSTGRIITKSVFDSEVTSMDHDHAGQLIFCGNGQGCIYSVSMDSHTGALSRSHRYRSINKQKCPVTTVQYRSFTLLAGGPVLLTCTQDGSLSFFSVALEIQGYLTLCCSLKLSPRICSIRASFCPLLSLDKLLGVRIQMSTSMTELGRGILV